MLIVCYFVFPLFCFSVCLLVCSIVCLIVCLIFKFVCFFCVFFCIFQLFVIIRLFKFKLVFFSSFIVY